MRICYIADAGSIHTQRWVRHFAEKGHEVHLISPTPFGDSNIEGVKLYVLKKVRPQIRIISYVINLLIYIIQIKRLQKRVKPDILHAPPRIGAQFKHRIKNLFTNMTVNPLLVLKQIRKHINLVHLISTFINCEELCLETKGGKFSRHKGSSHMRHFYL